MTVTDTLGWTLLHFLWQGAAVALLLAVADRVLRDASARVRYAAACGAMLLMLACAAGTFAWLYPGVTPSLGGFAAPAAGTAAIAEVAEVLADLEIATAAPTGFSDYLPLLVYFWLAGVCVLGVRSLGGLVVVHRLRRGALPAVGVGQEQLQRLVSRLGVKRVVRLRESAAAQAPAVIGWLKPVILLPATALSGLTPQQIEALLAHELAHIRRHDYLVNLLQTAVETLLFYHPAVWWVGRRIRAERENCCDDLAVEVCGDPLVYARALARLEQFRQEMPQLAMASNRGSLLYRIQRLLSRNQAPKPDSGWQTAWNGAASVVICLIALWAAPQVSLQQGFSQQTPAPNPEASVDVVREVEVVPSPAPAPTPSVDAVSQVEAVPSPDPAPSVDAVPQVNAAPQAQPAPSVDVAPEVKAEPRVDPMPSVDRVPAVDAAAEERAAARRELRRSMREGIHEGVREGIRGTVQGVVEGTVQGVVQGAVQGTVQGTVEGAVRGGIHGGIAGGVASGVSEGVVSGIQAGIGDSVRVLAAAAVHEAVRSGVRSSAWHAAGLAHQAAQAAGAEAEPSGNDQQGGYIDGLAAAGVRDLSVDQLIELKTHGVTPEYVRQIQAAGLQPSAKALAKLRVHGVTPELVDQVREAGIEVTVDRLIQFRIHGVNLADAKEMAALGYSLTPEELVKMRIHGLTPELARRSKELGFGDPSFAQLLKMRIHGITPEFAAAMKDAGLKELTLDHLIKLRIHGAEAAEIREFADLGYANLSANEVVKLRVHGVTPAFVREVQRHGFSDLTLEKIIKLKQLGIVNEPAFI